MVSGILINTLPRDISRYNDIDIEDTHEEFGWKLVHGDVFRSPHNRMLLSVLVGNGAQILLMSAVTIRKRPLTPVFAALGLLSPSHRGSLATVIIVLYVFFGCIAGYVSARIYKMCGGKAWQQNVIMTAMLVPGSILLFTIILNFFLLSQHSSNALPFRIIFSLFLLWFFLSVPSCFSGAYFGFQKGVLYLFI